MSLLLAHHFIDNLSLVVFRNLLFEETRQVWVIVQDTSPVALPHEKALANSIGSVQIVAPLVKGAAISTDDLSSFISVPISHAVSLLSVYLKADFEMAF